MMLIHSAVICIAHRLQLFQGQRVPAGHGYLGKHCAGSCTTLEAPLKHATVHLDALQCARLALRKGLQDMLGGDAEGAQAMQDGPIKARHLSKLRVYVQRIVVPAKPVQRCLVLARPLLYHSVWFPPAWQPFSLEIPYAENSVKLQRAADLPSDNSLLKPQRQEASFGAQRFGGIVLLGWLVAGCGGRRPLRARLLAKAARAAHEAGDLVLCHNCAALCTPAAGLHDHHGCLAL